MGIKKRLLLIAAAAVLLYTAGFFSWREYSRQRALAVAGERLELLGSLQSTVSVPEVCLPEPTPVPTPTPHVPAGIYECPIDFEVQWEVNEDVYAWIEIPETVISLPLLQHPEEDLYYLNRTVDGHDGYPGSLFTYSDTSWDFSDFLTIIYGHNMSDDSMFGSLRYYRGEEWFEEHRDIKIYTPGAQYGYTVFAAVVYSDALIPVAYDLETEEGKTLFLESILENREAGTRVDPDIPVTTEDHILVLSTCIAGQPYNRYLLCAVQTEFVD